MLDTLKKLLGGIIGSLRVLLPIVLVIVFFQFALLQQPLPNVGNWWSGFLL
jgi:hypothetical protein